MQLRAGDIFPRREYRLQTPCEGQNRGEPPHRQIHDHRQGRTRAYQHQGTEVYQHLQCDDDGVVPTDAGAGYRPSGAEQHGPVGADYAHNRSGDALGAGVRAHVPPLLLLSTHPALHGPGDPDPVLPAPV